MANQKGMSDYNVPYDGTNSLKFDVEGDFFHVQSVDVGGVNVFLRFNEGKQISRQQGEGNRVYYTRVEVSASAACNIVLQLGFGYATDARATVNATITAPVEPAVNNPGVASVTVNATSQSELIAADSDRLEVLIKIPSDQLNGLWVADNTAAVDLGVYHEPGETIVYATEAALYAYNPGAAGVKATMLSMKKV